MVDRKTVNRILELKEEMKWELRELKNTYPFSSYSDQDLAIVYLLKKIAELE